MGYADIGPFGNTQVRTPNLDTLAKEGRKFTSYYATPVCSMSRACMMTGCYNERVSIPGVLFPNSDIGLNPSEITLAEVVKQKGYATAIIGKWHLGDKPEFLPIHQGFDVYFGLPYSNDMVASRKNMPPLPLYQGDKVIETQPDQNQLTRRYTEQAIKFIRAQKDGPFFLYLPHSMIHAPLAASEAFKGKSKLGLLGDAIEEVDWSVGQIMATLKELHLEDNTLVIFTSDNGPFHRAAPPFRGSKGSCFEGGVREPTIMRWPGKIPAGTTCDRMLGNIDMLPTFAKLTGATLDPSRIIDGKEITSLMFQTNPGPVRDTQLYYSGGKSALTAIRQGDWKLFVRASLEEAIAESNAESDPNGKKSAGDKKMKNGAGELYNLVTDPGETTNVAAAHPEIVAKLKQEAETRGAESEAHQRPPGRAGK